MQVHTKKLPTDSRFDGVIVDAVFRGPKDKEPELIRIAAQLGFKAVDAVPWREAFPGYSDEQLPGVSLAGARLKEGLTQKQLAEKIGLPQGYVSNMERGKRAIGKSMAKKLGEILNINYKVFL